MGGGVLISGRDMRKKLDVELSLPAGTIKKFRLELSSGNSHTSQTNSSTHPHTTFKMNPAISNLAIMLIMMQVSKRLDFENPDIVFYVRCAYASATLITLSIYLYIRSIILKKNDLTTIKFVAPPNAMAGETEGKLTVTTVKQYDIEQINQSIKGVFTGLAMMGFMHLYMKYTNPLVMQSISPIKSALEGNLAKIHLFGKPASGDLKRPFKAASMFGAFGGDEVKTDKQTIEQAETAGKGGIKQE